MATGIDGGFADDVGTLENIMRGFTFAGGVAAAAGAAGAWPTTLTAGVTALFTAGSGYAFSRATDLRGRAVEIVRDLTALQELLESYRTRVDTSLMTIEALKKENAELKVEIAKYQAAEKALAAELAAHKGRAEKQKIAETAQLLDRYMSLSSAARRRNTLVDRRVATAA